MNTSADDRPVIRAASHQNDTMVIKRGRGCCRDGITADKPLPHENSAFREDHVA